MSCITDTTDWQLNKTLPECMLYMFQHEIMCDISFRIGPEYFSVSIIFTFILIIITLLSLNIYKHVCDKYKQTNVCMEKKGQT
jgi:hypothetical protein